MFTLRKRFTAVAEPLPPRDMTCVPPMDFFVFAVAGFLAQLIDGALGMAYGVTCTSILLTFGLTPAAASASVHMAEIVTSGVSGHFHWRLGNVDSDLFRKLVWPGAAGGAIGAYLVTAIPADLLTPWISLYLIVMGLRVVQKALYAQPSIRATRQRFEILGFAGGFFDALGGGGWGPIVTSTLVGRGHPPRTAIGSVNRAEFFVTIVQSAMFVAVLGVSHWPIVLGLCVGGVLAAPAAAFAVRRIHPRPLMFALGLLIVALSLRTLIGASWSARQALSRLFL